MADKKMMKIAIIAGASHALKYKSQNLSASDEEILQNISKEAGKILENIDEDED